MVGCFTEHGKWSLLPFSSLHLKCPFSSFSLGSSKLKSSASFTEGISVRHPFMVVVGMTIGQAVDKLMPKLIYTWFPRFPRSRSCKENTDSPFSRLRTGAKQGFSPRIQWSLNRGDRLAAMIVRSKLGDLLEILISGQDFAQVVAWSFCEWPLCDQR